MLTTKSVASPLLASYANGMPGKWIEIASPEVPAAEVAINAIRLRVQTVQEILPQAVHEYENDIEYIHQLRVACRRADATLKAFRPLLGGKSAALQKWLRRIRRAAGPARDIDVLLARMEKKQDGDPHRAYLVARLSRQRCEAQKSLLQVEEKSRSGKFDRSLDRCLIRLGEQKTPRTLLKEFAQKALRKASRPVQQLAGTQNPTLEQLHELRIAGKRLRYTLEIFHGAFASGLRTELYPLVEKLQSRLGRMNDHATAQSLFQSLLVGMPVDSRAAYLARCIIQQHEAAELLRDEFLVWWTAERIATLESHLST